MSLPEYTILSSDESTKARLKEMVNSTLDAILSQVNTDEAYSGIGPYELRKKIEALKVLPDRGEGFEKTLKTVERDILPHLLRTWSTSYMPHLHSRTKFVHITITITVISFTFTNHNLTWC